MRELKALMHGLVNSSGEPGQAAAEEMRTCRELAFVMTDLEGSTTMASQDQGAFVIIQEIHDTVRS